MNLELDWTYAITKEQLREFTRKAQPELEALRHAAKTIYRDDHASINLPLDDEHVKEVKKLARKHKSVQLVVVCGIGGSDLGTIAVQEAILGKLHNLVPNKKPLILYADTVDPDNIAKVNAILQQTLKGRKRALLIGVSKSGSTTETIANFEFFLATMKRYRKSYKDSVIVTTDEDSPFWNLAKKEGFTLCPIPKKVGGRYSVFSPVGLLPLALLGINIDKLLAGAAHMRARCLQENDNPAIIRAAMLAQARLEQKNIADNFYFKTDLESVGKWYRQLMGESIGKEFSRDYKQVWMGITPTVSVGSTDLHSMAQLYFGGPNDKFFTIVQVKKWNKTVSVPRMQQYNTLVHKIQGKSFENIMHAIIGGVRKVLEKQRRPHCIITLKDGSEESIGELLQLHMMEMMFLGALLNVNPFDQPNVEAYKIETKKLL